jgi:twitching motility protein PilT
MLSKGGVKMDIQMNKILLQAVEQKASDIHITVGRPPVFRINGTITSQNNYPVLSSDHTKALFLELAKEHDSLKDQGELDFAYSISGVGRFRVNAFWQRGSIAMVLRIISSKVPTLEQLNLPSILADFTNKSMSKI